MRALLEPATAASRRALIVWLLALLACVGVISQSTFVADMSAFLPRRPTAQQQLLVDQITRGSLSRTLLLGIVGGKQEERTAMSRELAERLRASGAFALVSNGESAEDSNAAQALLRNRYLLSEDVTPERFTAAGLQKAIGAGIEQLSGSMGGSLAALFPRDPTGEALKLLADFSAGSRPQSIDGVWMSQDGGRAMLLAMSKADGADTDAQEQLLRRVESDFAKARQAPGRASLQLQVSGSAVFAVDARAAIKNEVSRLSTIGALSVVALLLLVFRSPRALGLCLLPVISGALAGTAAVSLAFGSVHGLTIGFGSTLIGEAVDYSIYYFIQSQGAGAGAAADTTGRRWLRDFWPTIRLGMLTSICGFVALLFSGFPGLGQLGVYSIAGLIAAALVTRFVLPQFVMPARRFDAGARVVALIERSMGALQTLPRVLGVLALCCLLFLWQRHADIWNPALSGLSPVSLASQKLDESLRADMGAPQMRHLMAIDARSLEGALAGAELAGAQLKDLQSRGLIDSFESPARLIPSQATQRRRQQALPEAAELSLRLSQAVQGLPVRAAKLQPFLDDVAAARAGPLLTRAQLGHGGLAQSFDALMTQGPQGATAFLPVRRAEGGDGDGKPDAAAEERQAQALGAALRQAAQSAQEGLQRAGDTATKVYYIDMVDESVQIYATYFDEILLLSGAGVLAIAALLAYNLRRARLVLAVMLPLALAVLLVMTLLVLSGERLNLLHLVGLLLIVAVGSNYALFFNQGAPSAADGEPAPMDATTVLSLLLACACTAIGFGVLAFSSVPVLHALGITVAPGAMLALLAAIVFARRAQLRGAEAQP